MMTAMTIQVKMMIDEGNDGSNGYKSKSENSDGD